MGCIRGLKGAVKSIRLELTPAIMRTAGIVVTNLGVRIADGKLTKEEARETGADCLKLVFGVTTAAAEMAITTAVRAINRFGVEVEELGEDDTGEETEDLN